MRRLIRLITILVASVANSRCTRIDVLLKPGAFASTKSSASEHKTVDLRLRAVVAVYDRRQYSNLRDRRRSTAATVVCKASLTSLSTSTSERNGGSRLYRVIVTGALSHRHLCSA